MVKKILCLLPVFMVLLLVGCGAEPLKGVEKSKTEIQSVANTENKIAAESKQKSEDKNDKIKDIKAIIEFVSKTPANKMTDKLGQKIKVFKNYETHYFDFTGEGHDDTAIVTWDDKDIYFGISITMLIVLIFKAMTW